MSINKLPPKPPVTVSTWQDAAVTLNSITLAQKKKINELCGVVNTMERKLNRTKTLSGITAIVFGVCMFASLNDSDIIHSRLDKIERKLDKELRR